VKVAHAVATVFGLGYVRYAPGTAGSIVALGVAWLIAYVGGRFLLLLAGILVLAIGAWASELYSAETKRFDPPECVIDEVAGQWITCAFALVSLPSYAAAFLLFRLLDILKPWPIRYFERLHGGIGIMADDLVAAIIAGAIIVAITRFGLL
jgi:phosphatidylglycerophosphatase A